MILLDSSHNSWKNVVLFVKSTAMVLDLWLDTSSCGPSDPNVVSGPHAPKSISFLTFQNFIGFILWFFFEKVRCCLWILEPGFWTYGWICLMGPRPQAPRSINFLRFHNFTGFSSWFWRKWGLNCENWSQGSGIADGSVFWAQVTQM